jgi:hypothetical protein
MLLDAYARTRPAEIARAHMRDISGGELLVKGKGGHQRRNTAASGPGLGDSRGAESTPRGDTAPDGTATATSSMGGYSRATVATSR